MPSYVSPKSNWLIEEVLKKKKKKENTWRVSNIKSGSAIQIIFVLQIYGFCKSYIIFGRFNILIFRSFISRIFLPLIRTTS